MMTCPNCNAKFGNDKKFCAVCGSQLNYEAEEQTTYTQPTQQPEYNNAYSNNYNNGYGNTNYSSPNYSNMTENDLPPHLKPISPWAYVGYSFLFGLPLVGLILLIIFACGGTENINLRNYARSIFCGMLIGIIIVVIVFVIMFCIAGSMGGFDYLLRHSSRYY